MSSTGVRRASAAILIAAASVAATLGGGAAGATGYDDPFFLGWTAFAPAIPGDYTPTTEQDCPNHGINCVDNVINEMTRRWDRLACDHNGAFSMMYLLTTMQYREAAATPGFFTDPGFVNHEDAVFADFYFTALDSWSKGRLDEVAPAWRIALQAAKDRSVTGYGDMVLGMNAHINRDLPFVLNAIGLTKPDGTSRKPDHDKVNEFLNEIGKKAMVKGAAVYDPTIDDGDIPGTTADNTATLNLILEWREEAWRKAEMLRDAPTLSDKLAVADFIETDAAYKAMGLYQSYKYNGLTNGTTATRDAYCASRWPTASQYLNLDPVS